MLKQLRDIVIERVKQRVSEGDCPTIPPESVEMLENVIMDIVIDPIEAPAPPVAGDAQPVAYMINGRVIPADRMRYQTISESDEVVPLYAAPPQADGMLALLEMALATMEHQPYRNTRTLMTIDILRKALCQTPSTATGQTAGEGV